MLVFNIVFTLFIPVLMILCGYLMYKHTPKDINGLVGYRTAMSMKIRKRGILPTIIADVCG